MDREIAAVAERLSAVVRDFAPLVGSYVHGSAALGGFVPRRSDVDLLFVVERWPDDGDAERFGKRLVEASAPCPGRGVEASVVTSEQARAASAPWPFVLHVATDPVDAKVVSGATTDGDPDLLLHYAVTRAAGIAIDGPPPTDVFGRPARAAVLAHLVDELEWASRTTRANEAYAVLNACRAWRYLETDELVSKMTGGSWAQERGGPTRLVGRALGAQLGLLEHRPLDPDGVAFVRSVQQRLRSGLDDR